MGMGRCLSKFEFGDGDGWNGRTRSRVRLKALAMKSRRTWNCHNYMIFDIKKDGKSILFPEDKEHDTIWMTGCQR